MINRVACLVFSSQRTVQTGSETGRHPNIHSKPARMLSVDVEQTDGERASGTIRLDAGGRTDKRPKRF